MHDLIVVALHIVLEIYISLVRHFVYGHILKIIEDRAIGVDGYLIL